MRALIKPAIIIVLLVIMLIPVMMIYGVISDRQNNRDYAKESIARSWTHPQTIIGPWLVVNYTTQYEVKSKNKNNVTVERRTHLSKGFYRPKTLAIESRLDVSYRYRSIFKVPTYRSLINQQVHFDFSALHQALSKDSTTQIKSAQLFFLVSDLRGFISQPSVKIAGKPILAIPNASGFQVDLTYLLKHYDGHLDKTLKPATSISLNVTYQLSGIESISFEPSALESRITIQSSWEHPSFYGDFLPIERTITKKGFNAVWSLSSFATGMNAGLVLAEKIPNDKSVSVKLFDPIDIYVLNDRAAKYAMLFIIMTFAIFYLFELLKKKQVHPIKYLMVGLSLALFFLLLLSFSEKVGFVTAYIVASIASISVVSFYMQPEFGRKGMLGLAALLGFMFGAILIILKLENEALIVGSVLAFMTLAIIMITTRSVKWDEPPKALDQDK